jgi:ADP-ribosylglycohydrolase
LGGAIGDAFGYEVEFSSLPSIRSRFGPAGIKSPIFHDGKLVVSDDTQMTLFTLEGLLRSFGGGDDWERRCVPSVRRAYREWYRTQADSKVSEEKEDSGWLIHQPEMWAQRAPGNTCLSALRVGAYGTTDKPINHSKGCGGAMRVAPVGLLQCVDPETAFRLGAEAAALTHGHPSGFLSAGMLAALIRILIDGTSLSTRHGAYSEADAIGQCCRMLPAYSGHEETLEAVDEAVRLAASTPKECASAVESLGGGWVGEEALAIALFSVLSAESFVEAISIAANHGGDSDSTASIAGQLWGASQGLSGVPNDWVSRLDVLLPLLHLGRELLSPMQERCTPGALPSRSTGTG